MRMMDVDKLKPHPKNKYFFDDIEGESWTAFLESIETSGVIEPVIVDVLTLTIVSGHQRVRACKALGIKQILADERGFESEDEMLKQLIECNIRQRGIGNINPVKFGRCIAELERIYGIRHGGDRISESKTTNCPLGPANQTELAEDLGVDKKTLQRAKKLAELPEDIQQMVMDGKVTASAASGLIAKLNPEDQKKLAEAIVGKDKVSGKEVQAEIEKLKAENKRLKEDNVTLSKRSEPTVIEKTVEVEVVPDDYEELKRQNQTYKADTQRLDREYKQVTSELADAKRQIKEMQNPSAEDVTIQNAQDSMDNFSIATYDYIRKYGGNVWAFDKWADVPETTRKRFSDAIKAISAFAQQMANNIGGLE